LERNDDKSGWGDDGLDAVAIVGMAGRFPGVDGPWSLWDRVRAGESCITTFTDDELRASGVTEALLRDPRFVRTEGFLRDQELFDASFFDIPAREAELLDPQHRLGLECAWCALEDAGYTPSGSGGPIGIFGGVGLSTYYIQHVLPATRYEPQNGAMVLSLMDKDYFVSRISYKLDLKGPAISINTSCSTSLVATHVACQSLLNGECRLALVGGAHLNPLHPLGYLHQEGTHLSRDGHCRPFDHRATGMVGGNGCAFVVLERLEDAVRNGDFIHAVIRASAVNNDGSNKVGFAAPGVEGQARVIAEALALADIDVETMRYVEAHGTGTTLGDPIEVAGLTKAYRSYTGKVGFCALGSVKANIGHLGSAAGAAGLINAACAVRTRTIPPLRGFEAPNPALQLGTSPFFVAQQALVLPANAGPFRASVSSLGIGGTNAHVVLDEAPPAARRPLKVAVPAVASEGIPRPFHVLPVSAKSEASLEAMLGKLEAALAPPVEGTVLDVAATLQSGRVAFPHRAFFLAHEDGGIVLQQPLSSRAKAPVAPPPVIFVFPGGGSQHLGMARGLFERDPFFRDLLQQGASTLRRHTGVDIIDLLYGAPSEDRAQTLQRTSVALPALFLVEVALARLLMAWGIRPAAMIGHSLGEYSAACLAGVFDPNEAILLVHRRGQLIETLRPGAMLGVGLPEETLTARLDKSLSLAAVNGPAQCVVTGAVAAIDALERQLRSEQLPCHRLVIGAAGHSPLVDPILEPLERAVAAVSRSAPTVPYVSNVTGRWVTPDQAQSPSAWARHLRSTVRFSDGIRTLLRDGPALLLEVGPGTALSSVARLQADPDRGQHALPCLPHARETRPADAALTETVGRLWTHGVDVDWKAMRGDTASRRIPLPTYAFDRKRYWLDPDDSAAPARRIERKELEDWFWVPVWRQTRLPDGATSGRHVLVCSDGLGVESSLAARLVEAGCDARLVASVFEEAWDEHRWAEEWTGNDDWKPDTVIVTCQTTDPARVHERLLALVRALHGSLGDRLVDVLVVTRGWQRVDLSESGVPAWGAMIGPAHVIPFEYPDLCVRLVDIDADAIAGLGEEVLHAATEVEIAYRRGQRWVRDYVPAPLPSVSLRHSPLRERGVYLITGGLGGIGLVLARHMAKWKPKLVLTTRKDFPSRDTWSALADGSDTTAPSSLRATIRSLLEIEEVGAEVLVETADVTSPGAMNELVERITARFGALHGVLHAAGVSEGALVEHADAALGRRVLAPKVEGTQALWRATEGTHLDFLVLFSSLSTVTSAYGGADYVSANGYMNQFARVHGDARRVIAVAWDAWDGVGMAQRARCLNGFCEAEHPALSPPEGWDAFLRILASAPSEVVVCTQDLAVLRKRNRGINQAASRTHGERDGEAASGPTPGKRPVYPRPNLSVDYVEPRTDLEVRLVRVWEDTLRVRPIGIDDNFFELGGESIVAVQILAKARSVGATLSAKDLFEGPTVRQMAERAFTPAPAGTAPGDDEPALRGLSQEEMDSVMRRFPAAESVMPLSPLQAFMVRESLRDGGHRCFINQAVSHVRGDLPVDALRDAFDRVLARHGALRCAFLLEGVVRPVQVVCPPRPMDVDIRDWTGTSEADQDRAFHAFLREDRERGVNVAKPPLLRLCVIKLNETPSYRLVLTGHHALMDGWSSHIVFAEVARALAGNRGGGGESPQGRPPLGSFLEWLGGQDRQRALAHFEAELDGYEPALTLPALAAEAPALHGETFGRVGVRLGAEATERISSAARTCQVTVHTLVQAAWALSLARWTGRNDVVFGVTESGRPESLPGAAEIVGQLCSALPLRVRVPDRVSPDWLRSVQRCQSALRELASVGLDEVGQCALGSSALALFDTHMVFESFPGGMTPAAEAADEAYVIDGWHTPLRVFVFPGSDLRVDLCYDATKVDGTKVRALLDDYVAQLAGVASESL
jgi:acyl transferase domain-containing protein/aryl carrier-like protein